MNGVSSKPSEVDFDAIVIGAGFGGLRMLHELRERGMRALVIEAASDVGGTWYYNRYPGARTDSEAWLYAFSFSKEIQDRWDWSERYPGQPEVLAYLRYVADFCDMRRDIQFDTRVESARFDAVRSSWQVATSDGQQWTCSFLITATGPLSTPYRPDLPGIDEFEGDWYLTGSWPQTPVRVTDKRVAVVGTGSTAVQVIPLVAQTAKEVVVFQRTPNFVLPARNRPLDDWDREAYRRDYEAIWARARETASGFDYESAGRRLADVPAAEQQRILERFWEIGGMRFLSETFDDLLSDETCNAVASEFVRNKIRAIVEDPVTAESLCPKDHPLGAKRPPLGHFYYEAFNRGNVRLVDVRDQPISRISRRGVCVGDEEYAADIIVFATGFDAVTGTLNRIDITGRDGASLRERWAAGPQTHLGICVDGFPNLFMVGGPQSPFANIPVVIDGCVEWIGRTLDHLREQKYDTVEPTADAVAGWGRHVDALIDLSVLSRAPGSWFVGGNIPGKPRVALFYFGGVRLYRAECNAAADRGYDGFVFG
jgi:cyclohexanone monooxygenase